MEEVYADVDRDNGQIYCLPDAHDVHIAGKAADDQAVTDQILEFELPGRPGWE